MLARSTSLILALMLGHVTVCRPFFVGITPGCTGASARAQGCAGVLADTRHRRPTRLHLRSEKNFSLLSMGATITGDGNDELDVLKFAFDRMERRGVRCQQLGSHEQAQLHKYAQAVAKSEGESKEANGYLNNGATAAWALAGRWRLVLAPQQWSWFLGFTPGADVLGVCLFCVYCVSCVCVCASVI